MRILLGQQGPPNPEAAALAVEYPWPAHSTFRVVTVIEPTTAALSSFASYAEIMAVMERNRADAEDDQAEILERLIERGWSVTRALVHGRAAAELVAEARAFEADLLIVGPQSTWPWVAPDLSLARDLLDSAPCPVVVARRASISRIVFGTDGSPAARMAEAYLLESPALADLPILVVSIAETRHPVSAKLLPGFGEFDAREVATRQARHRGVAEAAASRLAACGRNVDVDVRAGDIAVEIAAAVTASAADLVVLGADDERGLSRIVLGGVARDVLDRTDASVLVVRSAATTPDVRDRCDVAPPDRTTQPSWTVPRQEALDGETPRHQPGGR